MSKKKLKDVVAEAREFVENGEDIEDGKEVVENLLAWLDEISEKITSSQ